MTDTSIPPAAPEASAQTPPESPPRPETDWKAEAKKWESRAKENKSAADKLAEIEESKKSEIDKAMDRVTKAEAEVATLPAKVADQLRSHLVALHQIPADDAELFLTASDPELLLKQVDRLVTRGNQAADAKRKSGNHVPREGSTPPPPPEDEMRAFARGLFGGDPT